MEKLEETIKEFVKFRKQVKKPMTDYAVKLLKKKLDSITSKPEEQIAILEQSILNGWQGVYPIKDDTTPNSEGFQWK